MSQDNFDQSQNFEQIDADAVCEQCGSVNDEGTLLCKVCGNNLRDQRNRRIAQGIGPELVDEGSNRFRLLTGLLVALGILLAVYVVLNMANIEQSLVESLGDSASAVDMDFWTGKDADLYDRMFTQLQDSPSSPAARQKALDDAIAETSFNGRYVVIRRGELLESRIIGEAVASRKGDRVYFTMKTDRLGFEIRGIATIESSQEDGAIRLMVPNSASMRVDGRDFSGLGFALPQASGGHIFWAQSDYDNDERHEFLAYRVR